MRKLKKNTFIQGTLVTSAILIIIKILGALYVIPFYGIIGTNGGTLYSYAYNIYNLFFFRLCLFLHIPIDTTRHKVSVPLGHLREVIYIYISNN